MPNTSREEINFNEPIIAEDDGRDKDCSSTEVDATIAFQDEVQQFTVTCPVQPSSVKVVKVVPLPHARSEVWSYFGFIADDDGEIHDKKKTICRICATTLCYSGNTTNLFTHLKAMHPEVNPQKLAPTNKTPRTGKKSSKRKFYEDSENLSLTPIDIEAGSHYIVRNVFNSPNQSYEGEQHSPSINSNQNQIQLVKTNNNNSNNKQTNNNYIYSEQQPILAEDITNSIVNLIVQDCRPIDLVTGKGFEAFIKLIAPGYKIPHIDKLEQLVKKKYSEVRRNLILRAMDEE